MGKVFTCGVVENYLVGGLEQPRWPKLSSSTAVLTNPGSVGSPVAGHGHGIPYEFW